MGKQTQRPVHQPRFHQRQHCAFPGGGAKWTCPSVPGALRPRGAVSLLTLALGHKHGQEKLRGRWAARRWRKLRPLSLELEFPGVYFHPSPHPKPTVRPTAGSRARPRGDVTAPGTHRPRSGAGSRPEGRAACGEPREPERRHLGKPAGHSGHARGCRVAQALCRSPPEIRFSKLELSASGRLSWLRGSQRKSWGGSPTLGKGGFACGMGRNRVLRICAGRAPRVWNYSQEGEIKLYRQVPCLYPMPKTNLRTYTQSLGPSKDDKIPVCQAPSKDFPCALTFLSPLTGPAGKGRTGILNPQCMLGKDEDRLNFHTEKWWSSCFYQFCLLTLRAALVRLSEDIL